MGFFYRTIRIVENGIKPAYVFDGKPPELKAGVVRTLPALSDNPFLTLL
jgi:flap endonuclease-1